VRVPGKCSGRLHEDSSTLLMEAGRRCSVRSRVNVC
jgi:hypothetical protein